MKPKEKDQGFVVDVEDGINVKGETIGEVGSATERYNKAIKERAEAAKERAHDVYLGKGYRESKAFVPNISDEVLKKIILNIISQRSTRESAISELIKNANESGAQKVDVYIDRKHREIKVEDYGRGMTLDEIYANYGSLFDSIKNILSGTDENQGIGSLESLKLGNVFTLVSVSELADEPSAIVIDKDSLPKLNPTKIDPSNPKFRDTIGTTAYISDLDEEEFSKLNFDRLRDYLARQLRESIVENDLKITLTEYPERGDTVRTEVVKPMAYEGIESALNKEFEHEKLGRIKIDLRLFPAKNENGIVRISRGPRKTAEQVTSDISDLEGFDVVPWNTKRVGGSIYVEKLPVDLGRARIKDSKESKIFKMLIVTTLVEPLADELLKLDETVRKTAGKKLLQKVKSDVCKALAKNPHVLSGYYDALVQGVRVKSGEDDERTLTGHVRTKVADERGSDTEVQLPRENPKSGPKYPRKGGTRPKYKYAVQEGGVEKFIPIEDLTPEEKKQRRAEKFFMQKIRIYPTHGGYFDTNPFLRSYFDPEACTVFINEFHESCLAVQKKGDPLKEQYFQNVASAAIVDYSFRNDPNRDPSVLMQHYFDLTETIKKL